MVATLLGALALVVVVVVTAPEESPSSSTAPLVAPTTTTNPTTTTTLPTVSQPDISFSRQIPNVDGVLYAAVNGTSYSNQMRLFRWAHDAPATDTALPRWNGSGVEFNAAGDLFAFLGGQRSSSDLFVGAPEDFQIFRTGVDSFAWNHSRPDEIAWRQASAICQASLGDGRFDCFDDPLGELIGYDDFGYLVQADHTVRLLDRQGVEQGVFAADDALIGHAGRVLLVDTDDAGDRRFSELDTVLGEARPLPWAPSDALGEIGFVDWSPVAPLLAFLRHTPESGWLISVFNAAGAHVVTTELPGRFWNVQWDTSGVHVVAPGIIDETTHVVLVLNILTGEYELFPHPDWVQDVELVTGRCIDATLVTAGLTEYLVTRAGADIPLPRAVLSLDPGLESWLFVSGRVSDGPHHGDIATWALPGFGFSGDPAQLAWFLPMNEVAVEIEPGIANPYEPDDYGFTDWMDIDGARESRACVADEDGS